ncbi:hypothetical protein VOLCADRAFT_98715 [Volvox carteri f. nagariensis]|uniref:Uncharacterized protein n=1 Tax=Volvox carteri f. nagariensis TaxID=3068 RepID=D8UG34_VOLCA|nr:uncharacterized protein VOLCADRAFT_98715 [Volvox carteri f. nagariensis]EFJ41308.1 hypothetical protein VOLCADRAFT_98715 [Volvox carteri f. nagariensis]|eukprot:XP_002957642.1 hypothetical protein VOLCADRAFT_98715 [Volvox carteri f. nagariensis]
MAYTSRAYERNWNYEAADTTFDARVGKILAGGLDLKASLRDKALEELAAKQEADAAYEQREAAAARVNLNAATSPSKAGGRVDPRGYVWVDPKGRTLGPVGDQTGAVPEGGGSSPAEQVAQLSSRRPRLTERQMAAMSMNTSERSMALWKKLNPGCVEETQRTPKSTFKDHFGPKADLPEADKVDKTYHYQKTDFSEYTEVKLRLMNHLKS